jgi:mannose PTS system EIIA component
MVGIVVVGHGRLAAEMVATLEAVLGRVEGIEAVETAAGDAADAIRGRIRAAVERADRGRGVVILTDIYGDTQTNQSLGVARETGAEVVAGINMPMLIKLTTARKTADAPGLAELLRRYGQEHIRWVTEPVTGPAAEPAATGAGVAASGPLSGGADGRRA